MKYAVLVKKKREPLASAKLIGPVTRRAAEKLCGEIGLDATILTLNAAPLVRVIYTFRDAGEVRVRDWPEEERALTEQVRAYGYPESSGFTKNRKDFYILAEFETTDEDDPTAAERASDTLAELKSLWAHTHVDMEEETDG